jgi:hypothetical protein
MMLTPSSSESHSVNLLFIQVKITYLLYSYKIMSYFQRRHFSHRPKKPLNPYPTLTQGHVGHPNVCESDLS